MTSTRACILLAAAILPGISACREKTPAEDIPLAPAELEQCHQPLKYAGWSEPGSWPQFAHDPLHTGRTGVDLGSADLELAWQFQPTTHVWSYQPGFSVWSCPVVGTVEGRSLAIVGHYDRTVYAVDASTGEKAWEFRPGAPVFASPALAMVNDRPIVVVAATNRSIYGLDATNGEQIWQYETLPWSFTQTRSQMSSPTVVRVGQDTLAVAGVWNSDRSASRNVQSGEVIVLNAADGAERWRKRLGSVPITSPAVALLDGEMTVFVASEHGVVHAMRLDDGTLKWDSVLNEETRSSPSIGVTGGVARLFIGSRLHSVFALDPRTGGRKWRRQTGYWVDATPAMFAVPLEGPGTDQAGGGTLLTRVVAGSYDQVVYAWSASDGAPAWRTTTGNHAYSSVATAIIETKPIAFVMSWDDCIYMLGGLSGEMLWRASSGPLLWSHAFMGDSLWASPVVADVKGTPLVLFAAYDGVLYAYRPRLSVRKEPT